MWKAGSLTITRYFTPPFANTVPDVTSFDEAVRMFETTFDEAVRIRMRSDAPFGAYLSGWHRFLGGGRDHGEAQRRAGAHLLGRLPRG